MKNFMRTMIVIMVVLWLFGGNSFVHAAEEPTAESSEETSLWDRVKSEVSDLYDSAKEKIPEAIETIKEKTPEIIEKASEKIDEAQEAISTYREEQESEFWGWFENQTNPDIDSSPVEETPASSEPIEMETSEAESETREEIPAVEEETVVAETLTSESNAKVDAELPVQDTKGESAQSFFEVRDVVILILAGAIIFLGVAIFYAHREKRPS